MKESSQWLEARVQGVKERAGEVSRGRIRNARHRRVCSTARAPWVTFERGRVTGVGAASCISQTDPGKPGKAIQWEQKSGVWEALGSGGAGDKSRCGLLPFAPAAFGPVASRHGLFQGY